MSNIKVGDVVEYVPHIIHARQPNLRTGEFPWKFGWRHLRQEGKEVISEIRELSWGKLREKLEYLAKHADQDTSEKRLLVPLCPIKNWKAVVRNVNEDGSVDLDIECGTHSGVTLHYDKVQMVDFTKVVNLRGAVRQPHATHPAAALAHTCYQLPDPISTRDATEAAK